MLFLGAYRRTAYFKPPRGLPRASPFFRQTDGAATEECTIHADPCGNEGKTRTIQQQQFVTLLFLK